MADIFDQLNPQPPVGAKPTPSKGLKFNDSSAAGAPQGDQPQQVHAQTPSTGDIFDQINPPGTNDIFDQLNPGDEHYRQLYLQQKNQGLGDIAHGAWEGVKALGKMAVGSAKEVGQQYGNIEASAEQNPLGFQESEGARRLRATALEGVAQTGRNYLNMFTKDLPNAEDLASASAGGVNISTPLVAQIHHEINKPGGMVRNLLKKAGIITTSPEQDEAEYQSWKRAQQDKEELAKTPAAPAALQQLVSGGAEPLPETTAAVSMAADPLNYLSLGASPMAQAARKLEAGVKTASAAEKAAQAIGNLMKTTGHVLEKTGELPETLAQKVTESALGPQASETVGKFVSGAKVASVPLAVIHGGTPEVISAALEGAKRAGKVLQGAGEATKALAEADRNNPFGRLAALAKDPDAPEWMRYAASSPIVKAAAPVLQAGQDVAAGALHGAAIGAALGSANADTPEELGQSIGQMGAFGAGARALTLPAQNRARVMQRMADAAAELYHQNVTAGTTPETMKKVADSTMMNAAAAQKLFGDVKVRFLDGESGQFADQATQSNASPHSAGFWDPTSRTIYLNADSGRGVDTTLLHELTHPLFDSVVANRPELKAKIDSSLQRTGKTLDQAKRDYAEQVVGAKGFTNADDFNRAVTQYIDRMDKASEATHSDPNHWIYSEIMAESGMKAMKGKNLVTDIADPSLTTRAVQATKGLLEGLGVKFKDGSDGKTILPNFEDTITSPELRKSTYSLVRAMKDYRPGIDEPEPQGVKITPEVLGQHPGAPVHVLPNGEMGNDFMSQSASGKVVARPNKDIRKIVKNRRAEVNATYPLPQTEAPTTQDPKLQWRKTPSGLSERSGTTLGPDFDKLRTFNDDSKAKAHDLEDAISKGEARQGWYQQVGEGPDWHGSVSRDTGNVSAQHKQFLPINFHVDKAGNVLVRNYSLGAFNDKAQLWAGRHGDLSLDLWDGNVKEFKDDVAKYLDNHKNGLSGDTGIGEAKKNAINAFLVGRNATFEKANPLRSKMRGSDAQGVVRSYRLDRLETLAPHETEFAKPDYAKQVKNLSPEAKPAAEYPKPEDRPAFEQAGGALERMRENFSGQGIDLPSMSPDSKKPTVMVKGPDGKEYPFWYDGSADWGKFGKFHQLTAQEDVPGLTIKHSSITDKSLESKGFTWELPKTEEAVKPAAPSVERQLSNPDNITHEVVSHSPDPDYKPEKTVKGYKLFRVVDGKLYPLFVDAKKEIPMGEWQKAEDTQAYKDPNTGKMRVKSKLGDLAYRPGWHAGDLPYASHIGVKDENGNIVARRANEVWAEVEMAADKNYQDEATKNGTRPNGKFVAGDADLDHMPEDGYYRYKTNPNMAGDWMIGGNMKVNRVLKEHEVNRILRQNGVKPMPWEGGKLDLKKLGIAQSPDLVHYSNEENLKTLDPEMHGTGLNGAERARKRDYPELYQNRTYFGLKGYEKEPGLGENKYKAKVAAKDLYDYEKDPKDLYPSSEELEQAGYAPMDSRAAVTLYEKKIKDAGYQGYANKTAKVAAKFTPTDVRPSESPDTPAFKQWFGDSKATNEDGTPRVLYHGTRGDFSSFEPVRKGSVSNFAGTYDVERHGIFFTEDPKMAEEFATQGGEKKGASIMPVYVRAEQPIDLSQPLSEALYNTISEDVSPAMARYIDRHTGASAWQMFDKDEHNDPKDVIQALKSLGYDSAVLHENNSDRTETHKTWVAFDPEQIKSASGNRGTYDSSANISQSPDVPREMPEDKVLSRYASRIAALTEKNGGASFDVTSGKAPTKGFATSLYPDRTQLLEKGELTPEAIKAFAQKNEDLLAQPDHVVGTWDDKESGKTYLDVSYVAPNENIAKHAAEMFNQKAYWDIKGQKEVKTSGNGETMENMPPAVERVPQAKASFAATQELPKGEVRGPVQVALPEGTDNSKGRVRTVQESQHLDLEAIKNAPDTEGYRKKVVEQFRTQPGFRDIDPSDTNKAIDEINNRVQQNLQFLYDRATPEDRALWKQWYDFAHDMSHRWGKEYGIHGDVVAAINARLSPQMEWNNNVTLTRRALDTIKKDPTVTEADLEFLKAKITKEDTAENPQTQQSKNLMNRQLEALAGMKPGDKMSELDNLQAGMLMRSHNELYAPRSPLHDHNLKRIPGDYLKWSKPFQDLADVVDIYRNPSFENVSNLLGGNHKVRSFYNNHVDPKSPLWTTIDTHATAAANLYPYGGSDKAVVSNFGNPNHKNSGVNGVYPVYQDAYEKVAAKNGILPRELQSIVWEQMRKELNPAAKRMVQDAAKKAAEKGTAGLFETIWAKAEKGEITREQAQKELVAEFEKWNSKANHGAAAKKRAATEASQEQQQEMVTAEEIERMRQEFERSKKRGNEPLPVRPRKPDEPNPTPINYRKQRVVDEPF